MNDREEIESLAVHIAVMRIHYDNAKKRYEEELKNLQDKSLAYAKLTEYKESLEKSDSALRAAAVEMFKKTGDKKIAPGIGIRENKKFIYDPKEAFEWAKSSGVALSLNKKAFESYIAEGEDIPFARIEKVPSTTISKDLTHYLEEKLPGE